MSPEYWLSLIVRHMPADRAEWGAAMMAELAEVEPSGRWRFALGCTRVALFPPAKGAHSGMGKGILFTSILAGLATLALSWPEASGAWLASAIAFQTWALLFSKVFLFDLLVLVGLTWSLVKRSKGVQPWKRIPVAVQQRGRLAVEVYFGLLNPVLYLAVLTSGPEMMRLQTEWQLIGPLYRVAAGLLVVVWGWRLYGAGFGLTSSRTRTVLRGLLWASLVCLALFGLKDLILVWTAPRDAATIWGVVLPALFLLSPMYLIPGVLIYDYLRECAKAPGGQPAAGFLLLTDRASRGAIAAAAVVGVLTFAFAMQRRTEDEVRGLVNQHRAAIRAAAIRYDTDPRLIAALVYVTHRDQLSPFRDSLERIFGTAWTIGLPDRVMNRAFNFSLGIAQIKPLTAQAGAVLAAGGPKAFRRAGILLIEHEGEGIYEPIGAGWTAPLTDLRIGPEPPIPVYAKREEVVAALHRPEKNLETCAFLLALYQRQWENANPAWSIRGRPEILATLYQIGFARSKPHGAPRSNAFGDRVREAYNQPWIGDVVTAQR
ncbi:MAG: hypothetical protein FJW30_27080 [Acidobacteria bacterium]|nr:hypothetical protein [Acidobacteriota bacterium]